MRVSSLWTLEIRPVSLEEMSRKHDSHARSPFSFHQLVLARISGTAPLLTLAHTTLYNGYTWTSVLLAQPLICTAVHGSCRPVKGFQQTQLWMVLKMCTWQWNSCSAVHKFNHGSYQLKKKTNPTQNVYCITFFDCIFMLIFSYKDI